MGLADGNCLSPRVGSLKLFLVFVVLGVGGGMFRVSPLPLYHPSSLSSFLNPKKKKPDNGPSGMLLCAGRITETADKRKGTDGPIGQARFGSVTTVA